MFNIGDAVVHVNGFVSGVVAAEENAGGKVLVRDDRSTFYGVDVRQMWISTKNLTLYVPPEPCDCGCECC